MKNAKILLIILMLSILIGMPESFAYSYNQSTNQPVSVNKEADAIAKDVDVILYSGKEILTELQSPNPDYVGIYPKLCSNAAELEKIIYRVKQLNNYGPKESVVNSLTKTLGDMYLTIGRIEMEKLQKYSKGRRSMYLALKNKPEILPIIQDLAISAFNKKDYPKAEAYMDSLVDSRQYISHKVYIEAVILQREVKSQLGK